MKVTVSRDSLRRGLTTVAHAVAGKSTLPVLSNVHVSATPQGMVALTATNLEIAIIAEFSGQVHEPGATTLPAKLFTDVVSGLPDALITMTLDSRSQTTHIQASKVEANVKGIEADEFPAITTKKASTPLTIPAEVLREAITQVAFAAAGDDSRPVLAGVLLRVRGAKLTLAAADGFRLSVRYLTLEQETASNYDLIIPARALQELASILSDVDGDVEISAVNLETQVVFSTEQITLVSRLIEGKFPDFERIIPDSYTTRTIVDRAGLEKAIRLASYFAAASANIVRLKMESGASGAPGSIEIGVNAAEVGDNKSQLDANIVGDQGTIALNVKFFSEALKAFKVSQIALETQTPQSPAVLRPIGSDGFIHIVMPMTVR